MEEALSLHNGSPTRQLSIISFVKLACTKQAARKPTWGKAPRKPLATKSEFNEMLKENPKGFIKHKK